MEISPSLFDLEESGNVSKERVNQQASEILRRYDEMVRQVRDKITKVERTVDNQIGQHQIIRIKE